MKTSILTPQHFPNSKWSGGSSTQLYILPVNASYIERDFEIRISTAKVEVPESTFTSLPGIDRKLMILEGEITITHEGQYSKNIKPFDVDTFSGDWKTTAIGTCTDFNVMTNGKLQSELYHLAMGANSNYTLKPKKTCNTIFLYPTSGTLHLQLMNEIYTLENGNLLVLENFNFTPITLNSVEAFGFVVVEIS